MIFPYYTIGRRDSALRVWMIERPKAILFDLDGTLTRPLLDFPRIHEEMGIGDKPILEALAEMSLERRREAEAVLLRHEEQAAEGSTLNEGCHELLAWGRGQGLRMGVITRNSQESTRTVCQKHGLAFDLLVTREFGEFKPSPAPLLHACRRLEVGPEEAWMVGDGQFDVEAGLAANVLTVWVSHGRERHFPAEPWWTVRDLVELTKLLRDCPENGKE